MACTLSPFDHLGGQCTGTLKAMNEFFHISGMRKMGQIVFTDTKSKSEILHAVKKNTWLLEVKII